MEKEKKLKIALPILAVIMAFVWGPILFGSDTDKGDKNGKAKKSVDVSANGSNARSDLSKYSGAVRKKVKSSYSEWGRNPFTPGYDSGDLIVEGIVWDEANPKAVINGNILGVGDAVGGNIIVDISQTSVTIRGKTGDTKLEF